MSTARIGNVSQHSIDPLPFRQTGEVRGVARVQQLGGASNRERFKGLLAQQEKDDQFLVAQDVEPGIGDYLVEDACVVSATPSSRELDQLGRAGNTESARLPQERRTMRRLTK
ncbi:MAG TPA: hypothetical protein VGB18_05775, partial [Candidatus Thermoplasmatota archaeon]